MFLQEQSIFWYLYFRYFHYQLGILGSALDSDLQRAIFSRSAVTTILGGSRS